MDHFSAWKPARTSNGHPVVHVKRASGDKGDLHGSLETFPTDLSKDRSLA